MKFIIGFFVGLLTGMLLILGPIVAIFCAVCLLGNKDDDSSTPTEEIPVS